MKNFMSKVKDLSHKAAELKAAMQQLPPKVAEIREAVATTAGQLQQLKSEIHYSVADLKADTEQHLSESLQEIHSSADVFEKAGFALSGMDLEISPVQRLLVHLDRIEDVHPSMLRTLVSANQHRRTTSAILSALLQARQMADTIELVNLEYSEVIVGIGPVPTVRLCWKEKHEEETHSHVAPVHATTPAHTVAAPAPVATPSIFGQGSFFEHRSTPTHTVATTQPVAAPVVEKTEHVAHHEPAQPSAPTHEDPLARFKKMPSFSKYKR